MLSSMFLRTGCGLPPRLRQEQEPFDSGWMLASAVSAAALDVLIRDAGWHFMWIVGSCTRRGTAHTGPAAIHRAVALALKKIAVGYNAAELGSVHISKWPGFQVAKVTLYPRLIREQACPAVMKSCAVSDGMSQLVNRRD